MFQIYKLGVVALILGLSFESGGAMATDQAPVTSALTPPIPSEYLDAAKALLGTGYPDPRRGVYSRVTGFEGNSTMWQPVKDPSFGWVEPDGRHAVMLNGLERFIRGNSVPVSLDWLVNPDAWWFDYDVYPTPELPALLLAVGQPELARRFYANKFRTQTPGDAAGEFVSDLWVNEQEACAQARSHGNDFLSIEYAREMIAVAEYARDHSLKLPAIGVSMGMGPEQYKSAIPDNDVDFSKMLLADCKARVVSPPPKSVDLRKIRELPLQERVAALISALELPQVGSTDYGHRTVLQEFAKLDDQAVPFIRQALKTESRLTLAPYEAEPDPRDLPRITLGGGPYLRPSFYFWAVKDGELEALRRIDIAKVPIHPYEPPDRAGWAKIEEGQKRQITDLSQSYRAKLADDNASMSDWVGAAWQLTAPVGMWSSTAHQIVWSRKNRPVFKTLPRPEQQAIVEQIVARCQMAIVHSEQGEDIYAVLALNLGSALAKIDLRRALPILKAASPFRRGVSERSGQYPQDLIESTASSISIRIKAGDSTAESEYQSLLALHQDGDYIDPLSLQPLWRCVGRSRIQEIGGAFFRSLGHNLQTATPNVVCGYINQLAYMARQHPLLTVPAFRELLVTLIKDSARARSVMVYQEFGRRRQTVSRSVGPFTDVYSDGVVEVPPSVTLLAHMSLSVGDLCCDYLSHVKGSPPFDLSWGESDRAAGRDRYVSWLSDRRDWLDLTKTSPDAMRDGR